MSSTLRCPSSCAQIAASALPVQRPAGLRIKTKQLLSQERSNSACKRNRHDKTWQSVRFPRCTASINHTNTTQSILTTSTTCSIEAEHRGDRNVIAEDVIQRVVARVCKLVIVSIQATFSFLACGILRPVLGSEIFSTRLGLPESRLLVSAVPLMFAAATQSTTVNTPLTVIASAMSKWLELYGGLLFIRVLLSWFPNIDWERQPMMAVRDMCDPYLNLYRNILVNFPPLFF